MKAIPGRGNADIRSTQMCLVCFLEEKGSVIQWKMHEDGYEGNQKSRLRLNYKGSVG